MSVSTVQNIRKFFRDSLVTEIFWESKIDYSILENNNDFEFYKKLSFLVIIKKFFSKKIRRLFKFI
ncbi:MAG: hypothetical protein EB042_02485 [Proteobacteria bacterium]|nr:hypothetical protein [Pseudomonadota bacterium]